MEPRPAPPVVRLLRSEEIPAAADMLVRSFATDPVANFMFAGPARRRRGLHSFFTAQIRRQYFPQGHVYATDDLSGVAIWGSPHRHRDGLRELLQLVPTAPFLASTRTHRALQLLFEIDAIHPKEPHWYLATVGTEPDRQGQGIGSALLRAMLQQVDEEGTPAYLESSKEQNVPLYARFGFEVMEKHQTRETNPPMWRMWREPRVPEL